MQFILFKKFIKSVYEYEESNWSKMDADCTWISVE